ncbi:ATP-dependent helicase [Actinomarinicola tropica]|uniref:ATP-dependent helicase n=1 Tax=Actinomarinicola tropica TaxID=2789776 RepID=UPI001E5439B6|nr:ATP-dependent DNA helicase [Actinomarinicola tropica]
MTEAPIDGIPVLEGEAADAVAHRGSHIQIIAAAGAGKTEVVSQRIASLLETEPPESIVAFTFTDKAAEELKERIRQRVTAKLGEGATDQLGRLYVGTIHGYCFRLLQSHVPRYETYTPLDANQLVNFLYREGTQLKLKQRFGGGKLFQGIDAFLRNVDVVENELIDLNDIPEGEFKTTLVDYYDRLDAYRFMSFGTQIVRAVEALGDPTVHQQVTSELRHLIVDEYQDVNPAQERLISLLAKPNGSADLVVVGDDDQAIYQWRGSNVSNIVTFADRYQGVEQFRLLANRRSRAPIVELANHFAQSIPGRLAKQMLTHREPDGPAISIAAGHFDEQTEADALAVDIVSLHDQGVPYRDIAILVRGKVAYPCILDALETFGVPVQPGGRSGLFEQAEAAVFGATYAWLADVDWSARRWTKRETVELDDLVDSLCDQFDLDSAAVGTIRDHLEAWKPQTLVEDFDVSLVGDFYEFLGLLGVRDWDTDDELTRNRLGTIARFATVLGDYEAVARRSRRDAANPGEQVGGAIGSEWFYRNLALLLVNYAIGGYDDFDGEEDLDADAVALGTIHGAKGLEWPVVFLPSLTDGRFPSSRTGQAQTWLLPAHSFDAARYEGSDADERRLFYVALTRARDWVALSSHLKVNKQGRRPSPYLTECAAFAASGGYPTGVEPKGIDTPDLAVTYSELAAYLECPQSYLLRNQLGFQAPIRGEVGYGNAVHHIMRMIAEQTKVTGTIPTPRQINDLLTFEFFLPFANKPAHKQMRENARKLVFKYVNDHQPDLLRTWATERPFELYLPGAVVSGRADVIYDGDGTHPENLVIVDYKTSTGGSIEPLQLQVYADAGRREGLNVQGAFVHDMATTQRHTVDVTDTAISAAETTVLEAAESLRARDFTPAPEKSKCGGCDVRHVCKAAVR